MVTWNLFTVCFLHIYKSTESFNQIHKMVCHSEAATYSSILLAILLLNTDISHIQYMYTASLVVNAHSHIIASHSLWTREMKTEDGPTLAALRQLHSINHVYQLWLGPVSMVVYHCVGVSWHIRPLRTPAITQSIILFYVI